MTAVDQRGSLLDSLSAFEPLGSHPLAVSGAGAARNRVAAVRAACPDAILAVDANQGFTPGTLQALWPVLTGCGVTLVEQPYPVGNEAWLDAHDRAIPIAADESVQSLADIDALRGRFDIVNILDQVYQLRAGTGVGVGAPQYGPRRAFYGGVSFDF